MIGTANADPIQASGGCCAMMQTDFTHDPTALSWVESANGHPDFPIQNLPLGVFSQMGRGPRGGVAIGDKILDIAAVAPLLDAEARPVALLAGQSSLNDLLGVGKESLLALRRGLFRLLRHGADREVVEPTLIAAATSEMHLPARIGDYTDFYTGIQHAENVGKLFRPDNPLLPNYKYVPIGYHGRGSSIRPSATSCARSALALCRQMLQVTDRSLAIVRGVGSAVSAPQSARRVMPTLPRPARLHARPGGLECRHRSPA